MIEAAQGLDRLVPKVIGMPCLPGVCREIEQPDG